MVMVTNTMVTPQVSNWITAMRSVASIKKQLIEKPWRSQWFLPKIFYSFFNSLALIPFIDSPITGFFISVALVCSEPMALAAVILAFFVSVFICTVMKIPMEEIISGRLLFNSTLLATVATSVMPAFVGIKISWGFWGMLLIAIIFTVLVNICLYNLLSSTRISYIGVPFIIVIVFFCLFLKSSVDNGSGFFDVVEQQTAIVQNSTETVHWRKVLKGTILAAGAVFGTTGLTSSILIWIGILLYSPMVAIFIYTGSFIGTVTAVALYSPLEEVHEGLWGFNAFLATAAMCCFLQESTFAMVCAFFAAIFSTAIQTALTPLLLKFNLLVFSIPGHLAMYTFILMAIHEESPLKFSKDRSPFELRLYNYLSKEKDNLQIISVESGPLESTEKDIPQIIVTESNGKIVKEAQIDGCFTDIQYFASQIVGSSIKHKKENDEGS